MEVGDIFWLPKYKAPTNIGGHFVVVLRIDIEGKMVYIQILQSGIFKIFENFGILNQNGCASCSTHEKTLAFKRYLSNRGLSLDVDSVIFLNYKKYNHFLFKETFICYKNLEKIRILILNIRCRITFIYLRVLFCQSTVNRRY